MPTTVTACPNCRANVSAGSAKFCLYCGSALPQAETSARLVGEERTQARFRALAEHPRMPRLLRRNPSAVGATLGFGIQATFGVIFTGVSILILVGFGAVASKIGGGGLGGGLGAGLGAGVKLAAFVPLLFVFCGIWMVVSGVRRAQQVSSAPTKRISVRVADERIEVSGGGNNSSASTTYFMTLEDERGRRTEYRTQASVAGAAAPDDMGIAYVKAFLLLDFQRVRV